MIIVIEKLTAIIAQTLLSKMKKPRIYNKHEAFSELFLLPDQDSNLDRQNQNLQYYRYTIGQLNLNANLKKK